MQATYRCVTSESRRWLQFLIDAGLFCGCQLLLHIKEHTMSPFSAETLADIIEVCVTKAQQSSSSDCMLWPKKCRSRGLQGKLVD